MKPIIRVEGLSKQYRIGVRRGTVVIQMNAYDGSPLLLLSTQPDGTLPLEFSAAEHCVDCMIENIPLGAGEYVLGWGLAIPNVEWLWGN